MNTVGERIKEARRLRGLTRPKLAEVARVKYPTLAGIENNDQAGTTQLPQIADALGVSAKWLQTGKGAMDAPAPQVDESEYADVIGYSQAAGLGAGAEAVEYAETHSLKFKKTSLRRRGIHNKPLAVYYGKGDSMEPTIEDGDAILFDTSDTRPVDGVLYVIQVDGQANPEYYVKRAMVLDAGVYFASDNPAGDHNWRKPRPMNSPRNPITVIGRVHWIGGWAD
ncbi:S24 family peptidase [Stenotrophomonas sp.]|uniref:XRE family transcriptional regulator n=1 Tax=Stenotrophomonas sp. TaxID=69392 RepID=UPI00289F2B1B|nr:S24 family peptidase [Stenotrophomonas sp.]